MLKLQEIKNIIELENFKLTTKKYSENSQKLNLICFRKHRIKITWQQWLNGKRCHKCFKIDYKSIGAYKILKYLKKYNIETEYKMSNCKNIYPLPFDFAIKDDNNNLVALIEFNGKQHYYPIKRFGGKIAFKKQQMRDEIKKKYCQVNNIPLLIISYKDENNIDELCNKFLVSLNICIK